MRGALPLVQYSCPHSPIQEHPCLGWDVADVQWKLSYLYCEERQLVRMLAEKATALRLRKLPLTYSARRILLLHLHVGLLQVANGCVRIHLFS